MNLRICDGERERKIPGSIEILEELLAPEIAIREGTEITLVDGERWLAAVALGGEGGDEQFLLSGAGGGVSFRVGRREMLRQFRQFISTSVGT
jgi:hypothetical protein